MTNIAKLIRSRQFWVLVALFVVNGISGIKDQIPANVLPVIDAMLGLAAVYLRIYPKQQF
jgi:hypothetical protein